MFIINPSVVFAFEKTESGIGTVPNLPTFTDEEFLKAPVRIEIFSKVWCPYCQKLEDSMIDAIYSTFSKDLVAIRILDAEHPEVAQYFAKYEIMFDMPDDIKGKVPTIVINGKYLIVGYKEELDEKIILAINQLLEGQKPSELDNAYLLKEEFLGHTDNLIYQYKEETNNTANEDSNTNIQEELPENSKEKIKRDVLADNITFFATYGLSDSKNYLVLAYILAIFLFFIESKRKQGLIFHMIYILGMMSANFIVKLYDTGLYTYRQPILIGLSLFFAYVSLSIFWDILFDTLNKTSNVKLNYKRKRILDALQKFLNSKISYVFAFIFGFIVYLVTIPFDLDYAVAIYANDNLNTIMRIVLLIVNGLCFSIPSIFLGIIVESGKKMVHELIEPLKKYNYLWFYALFYASLTMLLIYYALTTWKRA